MQIGLDLLGADHDDGSLDRVGLFFTHAEASGNAIGYVLGSPDNLSGRLNIKQNGLGAYWTHVGSAGWYVDAVGMVNWLDGSASSTLGVGADLSGRSYLASLEGGYPFEISEGWKLEPQAQIIWQRVNLDHTADRFSSIEYGAYDGWTGRLGLRLEGDQSWGGVPVQPVLEVNLWHNFSTSYDIGFNDRSVTTELEGTSLEVRGGLAAQLSQNVSAYGSLHFRTGLGGAGDRGYGGNVGLRVKW
jgi:outer membrane autotransporter protein